MRHVRTIVISDLHVGAGELDDCDAELERHLADFLLWLGETADTELVINGDFLDFVQAPPWRQKGLEDTSAFDVPLCFTELQSLEKFEAVVRAHPTIFAALHHFLASAVTNRITILPGNHDADFFWPRVRAAFFDAVEESRTAVRDRLVFHLEQSYRPPKLPDVWIEHGHQYDRLNAFFVGHESRWSNVSPPIFDDSSRVPRLLECTGTRFMIRFMNQLDAAYPFVDNIKPFSRFVKLFGMSALVPGQGPLKATVAVWAMLRFIARTSRSSPGDFLGLEKEDRLSPVSAFRTTLAGLTAEEQAWLSRNLRERGASISKPLEMICDDAEKGAELFDVLAENLDLLDGLGEEASSDLGIGSDDDGMLGLARGFVEDETQALIRAAAQIAEAHGTKVVVMGHTHEPVERPGYLNTGSWTRYYRFDADESSRPWSMLRKHSFEAFPYELRYAELVPGSPARARTLLFRQKGKS